MHVYNESKETQPRTQCRATTEYNYFTGHLNNSTSPDWRHTHTFTQNPKEMEVATSLYVESSFRDRNSEPLRRGPRAHAARRSCGPPDSTDGVSGKRTGFVRRYLPARSRDSRARARTKRQKKGRLAGTTDKKQESDFAGTKPRRPTNQPGRPREKPPRPSFCSAGLRPSLRPVPCSTPLRDGSRKVSKGGVPPPWPRHTAHPPIGRSCTTPPPSHQARRRSG